MKYNIAIVEDFFENFQIISNYLKKYSEENKIDFDIFYYQDGDEVASDYQAKYDIIFMDIEMKRLDGMAAAKKIREFDKEVIIIFITNKSQYAIKGYEVNALSFLVKPVPYFAFSQELKKSLEKLKSKKKINYLFATENGKVKVTSNEVLFIESFKHSVIFHLKDKKYETRGTIKKLAEELEEMNFHRCNNCYLVNLAMIEGIEDECVLIGKHVLKISRPRKKIFMDKLVAYMSGRL